MTIDEALAPLGVPVKHPPYKGNERTYITYRLALKQSALDAEGERATQNHVAIDLFTNRPWGEMAESTKMLLKDARFYGITYGPEIYEDDTKLYHIPFSCWRLGNGEI